MRAFVLFLISFLMSLSFVMAQPGHYFLSHYAPSDEKIDYLSFSIAQTSKGVIYFANKNGIVEFDGRNWSIIETPGAIYSLSIAENDKVFAGGLSGFGMLDLDESNTLSFHPLLPKEGEVRNVFSCNVIDGFAYFINEQNLFVVDVNTLNTIATIKPPLNTTFDGLYNIGGKLFVSNGQNKLLSLENNQLVEQSLDFLQGEEILFSDQLADTQQFLIGTSSGRVFIFSDGAAREVVLDDDGYVVTYDLVNGRWINERLFALGTLSGGVIFINASTGKEEEVINYYAGLPDNEVFSMMTDQNQGLWVAHDYGFTRIAPYLPFRSYNHYPGLSGNLLSAYSEGNNIYVGTSVGLFKLNRKEIYDEEVYYVTRYREKTKEEDKVDRKKSRKGLFGFLKKNKGTEEEKKPDEPISDKKKVVEKRTREILRELEFSYQRVGQIEGKVSHLQQIEGKLIAAGVDGVFEIEELNAKEIIDAPVRTLFFSPTLQSLLVSTYDDKLLSLQNEGKEWIETHLIDTLNEYVGNIFEDNNENIWLCGRAAVVKVEVVDGAISTVSRVPFLSSVLDETKGFALGNEVFVAASGAFHRYDVISHQFEVYDSLPGPRKYFNSGGSFWYNDGHRWRTVDRALQNSMNLEWLGLFPDIRTLTIAGESEGLWLITSRNELYRFTPSDLNEGSKKYPLFLREVRGPLSRLQPSQRLTVDERESALAFEFIQPGYTGATSIEYQYLIEGINKDWSEWSSSNNVVNFPFLTPGTYKLKIKSRDLFGQVSEIQFVDFRVLPPYWKRTWFYAAEFVFFALLVFLSLKLGAGNAKYRNISRLLSILTIIMLIQLMQNTVESFITVQTTPVVDFFIQVFIALLILPLESRMRRFMIEASERKLSLKKVQESLKGKLG